MISNTEDYFSLVMKNVQTEEDISFRMQWSKEKGRHLVASKCIQPGQVIFREPCLLSGPLHSIPPVCLNCFKRISGDYKCPECNFPLCNADCRGAHRDMECNLFRLARNKITISEYSRPNSHYQCIAPLRCLLTRDNWAEKWRIIQMMESQPREREGGEHWNICQANIVDYLTKCWKLDFPRDQINHVIGVLEVNSFGVLDPEGGVGRGLFPLLSLLSHSCASNTKYIYSEDGHMECIATVPIRKGEELTDHYVSILENTVLRRKYLREGWYFDCQCLRCQDPTELGTFTGAIKCKKSCCEGFMLPNFHKKFDCSLCGFTLEYSQVENILKHLEDGVSLCDKTNTVCLEELLDECLKCLHPSHSIIIELKRNLISIYVSSLHNRSSNQSALTETRGTAMRCVQELLPVFDKLVPGLTKERGVLIYQGLYAKYSFNIDSLKKIDVEDVDINSFQEAYRCLERERRGTFEFQVKCEITNILNKLC